MKSYWWPAYVQNCMTSCEFLLLQDCQVVVLGTQLVSAAFGGLQLGVQLSFDLQRNTVTLSVQQSVSLRLHVLQVPVQSLGILRLSHCQTCEMTPVWRSTLEDLTEYLAAMNDRSVRSTNTTTEGCVVFLEVLRPSGSTALKADLILRWKPLHGLRHTSENPWHRTQIISASTHGSRNTAAGPELIQHVRLRPS